MKKHTIYIILLLLIVFILIIIILNRDNTVDLISLYQKYGGNDLVKLAGKFLQNGRVYCNPGIGVTLVYENKTKETNLKEICDILGG